MNVLFAALRTSFLPFLPPRAAPCFELTSVRKDVRWESHNSGEQRYPGTMIVSQIVS